MKPSRAGVPVVIPPDVWRPLMEVRAHLDAICPGPPTPIEETLRQIISHYEGCSSTQREMNAFRERAQAWKRRR